MNEPYSILIPCADKDFNKLPYLLSSIMRYMEGYTEIIISVRDKKTVPDYLLKGQGKYNGRQVQFFEDIKILDVDMRRCRYRPNWIYQQFLKLFQDVTENDLYFTIDADVIINRKFPLFTEEGKRLYYLGWEHNHKPYFKFQEHMLDLPRIYPHTGINDSNFMDKKIIKEMLERNNYTVDSFIEKSIPIIVGPQGAPDACYPAEPEIYFQYCMKYHRDKYETKVCKSQTKGILVHSFSEIAYTNTEIEKHIEEMSTKDIDIFMLHTWYRMPPEAYAPL